MSRAPSDVRVTSVDVPFLSLTWFFIKASLALGLAFALTSWVWVVLGSGVVALMAALLIGAGVPGWFDARPAPVAPGTPQVVVVPTPVPAEPTAAPSPPPPSVPVQATAADEPDDPPADEALPPGVDPNQEATDEAMRAELERARRERTRAR